MYLYQKGDQNLMGLKFAQCVLMQPSLIFFFFKFFRSYNKQFSIFLVLWLSAVWFNTVPCKLTHEITTNYKKIKMKKSLILLADIYSRFRNWNQIWIFKKWGSTPFICDWCLILTFIYSFGRILTLNKSKPQCYFIPEQHAERAEALYSSVSCACSRPLMLCKTETTSSNKICCSREKTQI